MAKNVIDIILKAKADVGEAKKELEGLYNFTSGKNLKNDQLLTLKEAYLEATQAVADYEKALESVDGENISDKDSKTLINLGKNATDTYNKFLRLWKGLPSDSLISEAGKSTDKQLEQLQKSIKQTWQELQKISLPELTTEQSAKKFSGDLTSLNKTTAGLLGTDTTNYQVKDFILLSQQIDTAIAGYQKLSKEAETWQRKSSTPETVKKWAEVKTQVDQTTTKLTEYNNKLINSSNALVATEQAAAQARQNIEDMRDSATGIGKELEGGNTALKDFAAESQRSKNEIAELVNQFARFTTLAGALQVITKAIRSAYQAVKELDEAMNSIAVVTDMTTQELWNQIDTYTDLATATGSTIKGSYEVAQLYYQQGLNTTDVMTATEETLKMARIAQIDYASATDYATAAIKGFNLAHEDLAHINDVYSNLAAKTAADTEEISIAMSKVASIAHSTGMELETTAAFLTQIISTTREAPETAGTALKTVIARFSEVKELISTGNLMGADEEGEEINVNKIEAALKTAGVQLRDTAGQMRDLDDVFIELASKWENLDTMQQRYIATQAAGSRQQSRFLALMNDYDGLMETVGYATDAAGASNEQFEKTLDSLESKLNALSNAWVEFTTGITDSRIIKGTVDILTTILETVNKITEAFGEVGSPIARVLLLFGSLRLAGGAIGSIGKALDIEPIAKNFGTLKGVLDNLINKGVIGNSRAFIQLWNEFDTGAARMDLLQTTNLFGAFSNAVSKSTGLTKAFQWLLSSGWHVAGVAAAIWAVIKILDHFIITANEAREAYKNFTEGVTDTTAEINNLATSYDQLSSILTDTIEILDESGKKIGESNWAELSKGVDSYGRNLNLTNEELATYKQLAEEIIGLGLAKDYDDLHQKLRENPNFLKESSKEMNKQSQFAAIEQTAQWDRLVSQGYIQNYKDKKQELINLQAASVEDFNTEALTPILRGNNISTETLASILSDDTNKLQDITQENYEAYRDYLAGLKQNQLEAPGQTFKSRIQEQINAVESAISAYEKNDALSAAAKESLEQAADAAREGLKIYAQQFDGFWEMNQSQQDWLLSWIESSTDFAINENTTEEQIEAWKDRIYNIVSIDWSKAFATDTDAGKDAEKAKATLMTMLPDTDETAAEWMHKYQETLQQIWNGMSETGKDQFGGDFTIFSQTMGMPQYDMSFISDQGIGESLRAKGIDYGDVALEQEFKRQLTPEQLETIMGGKINLGELIDQNASIDTLWDFFKIFDKEWERYQETASLELDINFEEMADAARDLGDDLEDIDFSDIIDDKVIDESDKFTESWFEAKEAFTAFREEYGEALDTLGETSNLDLSAEGLTQLSAEAKLAGQSLAQYALEKIRASNIILASSVDALNADAGGAANSAAMFAEAANAQWAYDHHQPYTTAGGKVLSGSDLGKYAASMGGYASLVGASTGGKSGGGGGGGGSKEPAKAEQDPFYNYIKQVEQYEHALERLENQWEITTDPSALKENLEEQEDALTSAMAANQAYLTEVDTQLSILRDQMSKKYGEYMSFAEDGSIRLNEKYFNATGKVVEEMDAWIDQYDDILGRQTDLNNELDDYKKQLKDLWEGWRDDYIDLTDQIAEIYQERDEKILEEKEEYYEALEEQDQKYLDSVRKNIEAERKARQKAKNYEDIADKQKRLALLERDTSGRYTSEVLQLREEIGQSQQDMADQEVDDMLEALERQMDEDAEQHKEILEAMQKQIDDNVETRVYIERAEATIAQGDQAILAALMSSEEFLQTSTANQQKMIDEWGPQIVNAQTYIEKGFTSVQDYLDSFSSILETAYDKLAQAIGEISVTVNNYGGGGGGGSGGKNPSTGNGSGGTTSHGYTVWDENDDVVVRNSGFATKEDADNALYTYLTNNGGQQELTKRGWSWSVYKKGGLVDFTGPAWVDGTPGNPEAFLNADQTRIIGEFAQHLSRLVNHSALSFSTPAQPVSGGDCNITIEIGSLGADYDIDKAIGKVKDEIMRATSYRGINIVKRTR